MTSCQKVISKRQWKVKNFGKKICHYLGMNVEKK